MYQGKNHKRSFRRSGKSIALLVSLILIISVTVGGTIAFLVATDGPLHNLFTPSQVTTKVEETLSGNTKSNVCIQNTGDTVAWIRAAVVITWQDQDGNVYGRAPVLNTDYSISYDLADPANPADQVKLQNGAWVKGNDGFYYWTKPVLPDDKAPDNCSTGVLITSCSTEKTVTVGGTTYYLNVEIMGSGIQSKPARVFNTEWQNSGLTVNTNNEADPLKWTLKQGGAGE